MSVRAISPPCDRVGCHSAITGGSQQALCDPGAQIGGTAMTVRDSADGCEGLLLALCDTQDGGNGEKGGNRRARVGGPRRNAGGSDNTVGKYVTRLSRFNRTEQGDGTSTTAYEIEAASNPAWLVWASNPSWALGDLGGVAGLRTDVVIRPLRSQFRRTVPA